MSGFPSAIGGPAKQMRGNPNHDLSMSTIALLCHGRSTLKALRLEVSVDEIVVQRGETTDIRVKST